MAPRKILYLSRKDVKTINLPMEDIIKMIEKLCVEKGEGFIEVPPKKWLHPKKKDSFFSSMPCQFTRIGLVGCKWQSGFPTNSALNLPYIIGLIIINDIETGYPLAIMDSSWIVGMRTAAASAVAAKYLAREDVCTLAIIGCGVQGRAHAEAMLKIRPKIKEIKAYDINNNTLAKYAKDISKAFKVTCTPADSPELAATDSDIIVTAGVISSKSEGILNGGVIKQGAFICPVDYDSYWKKEAFAHFDKIFTDDIETLNDHRNEGYFKALPDTMPELAEVVCGKVLGRENHMEKILFMNIGIGLSDIIVANKIFELASARAVGNYIIV